jgi:hypothetical protein
MHRTLLNYITGNSSEMNPTDFIVAKYKTGRFTELNIVDVRSSFSNKEIHLRNSECLSIVASHNEKDVKSVARSISTIGVYGQPFPLLLDCIKKAARCLLEKREVLYVNILADHEGLLSEFLSIGYPDKMRKLRFFTNFINFKNTVDKVMEYKEFVFQIDLKLSESTHVALKTTDAVEFTEKILGDKYNLVVKGNTFKFTVNDEEFVAIGTDNCVLDYKPKSIDFYMYLMRWNDFVTKNGLDLFLSLQEESSDSQAIHGKEKIHERKQSEGVVKCLAPPDKRSEEEFLRLYGTFIMMSELELLNGKKHSCLWTLIILNALFPDLSKKEIREEIKKFYDSLKHFKLSNTSKGFFFKWKGKNKRIKKEDFPKIIEKYAERYGIVADRRFWRQFSDANKEVAEKAELLREKDLSKLDKDALWIDSWDTNMLL